MNALSNGRETNKGPGEEPLALTLLMPCLDEAETVGRCIEKARIGLAAIRERSEILIADNGSRDGSDTIARGLGARVLHVKARGYGNAILAGIEAARGHWIVLGDADDSYDFSVLHPFVERLRAGAELVVGNRFRGGIEPGAMPWMHRFVGTPAISAFGRLAFGCAVRDFNCGLRAFTRSAAKRMNLAAPGMELASEMIIQGTRLGLQVDEVPVRFYKDGRSRPPHLQPWRDGWRCLRMMAALRLRG